MTSLFRTVSMSRSSSLVDMSIDIWDESRLQHSFLFRISRFSLNCCFDWYRMFYISIHFALICSACFRPTVSYSPSCDPLFFYLGDTLRPLFESVVILACSSISWNLYFSIDVKCWEKRFGLFSLSPKSFFGSNYIIDSELLGPPVFWISENL